MQINKVLIPVPWVMSNGEGGRGKGERGRGKGNRRLKCKIHLPRKLTALAAVSTKLAMEYSVLCRAVLCDLWRVL